MADHPCGDLEDLGDCKNCGQPVFWSHGRERIFHKGCNMADARPEEGEDEI